MDIIIYPKTFKIRLAFTWGLLIMAWSTLAGGVARLSVNNDAVATDGEALQRPEKAIGVFSIKKTDHFHHVNLQSQKKRSPMNAEQPDLLPDLLQDTPHLHALIDRMETVAEETLQRQWPQLLGALVDVMDNELQRQGFDPERARLLARKQAAALAAYAGGRNYYLPKGDTLFNALRDDEIFSRWFKGTPIESLRREYRLGQQQIYHIIATQRQLHARRTQPDLFAH